MLWHIFQLSMSWHSTLNYIEGKGEDQDIILFIHGWHHNAKYNDENVKDFERLLKNISLRNKTRKINGIYVGWRGESISLPILNVSTFWDRKNVSIDVGQGSLIELLVRLEDISQSMTGSRLISIGHSFGGSVLFNATKNRLYENFIESAQSDQIKGFGELVVLVNPAFEAIPYAPLRDISEEYVMKDPRIYKQGQKPKLMILTSKDDNATKNAFWLGRFFSSTMENQNTIERKNRAGVKQEYSQYSMDLHAIGHYKPFWTHELAVDSEMTRECNVMTSSWADLITQNISDGGADEGWEVKFPASGLKLKHLSNSSAFNPFWVVSVDGDVIPDHNAIFQDNLNCFLEEVMLSK